jgi:hypothetical protein
MDNQQIVELFQTIGLPTALSIYLLLSNNKHMEKYEILIEKITGEIKKLNDNINDIQQDK